MDFFSILEDIGDGHAINPFAAMQDDEWIPGFISIEFLNTNFGSFSTAQGMIEATESEGLQEFFKKLRAEGKLP